MRADTLEEEGVTLFTVVEPHERMSSRSIIAASAVVDRSTEPNRGTP
jgi:hypothetical protein